MAHWESKGIGCTGHCSCCSTLRIQLFPKRSHYFTTVKISMSSTEEIKIQRYKAFLIALWNQIHTTTYGTDYNLSNDQIFIITPKHVCCFHML